MTRTADTTTWLFTRGGESVRMVQRGDRIEIAVCGPGVERGVHRFQTIVDLVVWQMDLERRLRSAGWTLERFHTERRRDRERRSRWRGTDRRRSDP